MNRERLGEPDVAGPSPNCKVACPAFNSEDFYAPVAGGNLWLSFHRRFPDNQHMQIYAGIITVSDRASKGLYDDLGGPALKGAADGYGWKVVAEALVPDEKRDIQRAIREQVNKGCQLILTTGGTGVALRDVTPEAVREIALRELPGFGEIMRIESMKITKNAILSRNLAVVVDKR